MTKAFPAIMTQGIDEPCRFEGEVFDLEVVEGKVPAELDGLLVQAVPDQAFPPEVATLHPMTVAAGGDGAVIGRERGHLLRRHACHSITAIPARKCGIKWKV